MAPDRRFILLAHRVPADGRVQLNDLAGASGRIDVACRVVTSAFLLSHALRPETRLMILVGAGDAEARKLVRISSAGLRMLNPDERSTAALLGRALALPEAGRAWRESTPGIEVRHGLLEEALREAWGGVGPLVWLREDAPLAAHAAAASWAAAPAATFILSDHEDLAGPEQDVLRRLGAQPASLGGVALQGHHCVTLVHYLLDRAAPAL